jgi:hypothetical protein
MRPSIGAFLFGLVFGGIGFMRWIERGVWVLLVGLAIVKPWTWDITADWHFSWWVIPAYILGCASVASI